MRINEKTENIIVAAISISAILVMLLTIGFEGIIFWLSTPIKWKENDALKISVADMEQSDDRIRLSFQIENQSSDKVKGAVYVMAPGVVTEALTLYIIDEMKPYEILKKSESFKSTGSYKTTYKAFQGKSIDELNLQFRIKELYVNKESVVNNHGWFKLIWILGTAILSAVLLHFDICKNSILKILFKLCRIPIIIVFAALIIIFVVATSNTVPANTFDNKSLYKKDAAKRYKRAADFKAGYLAHGNTAGAARAQRQMDAAMADMISTDRFDSKRYKAAADFKAGYLAHGDTAGAARAQRQMDSAMANMITSKTQ